MHKVRGRSLQFLEIRHFFQHLPKLRCRKGEQHHWSHFRKLLYRVRTWHVRNIRRLDVMHGVRSRKRGRIYGFDIRNFVCRLRAWVVLNRRLALLSLRGGPLQLHPIRYILWSLPPRKSKQEYRSHLQEELRNL